MEVGPVTWGLIGVSVALGVLVAVLVGAWLTGRLTIDLGWGRTRHPLGPLEVAIDAPRDVVFEVVASPYLGRAPRELRAQLEVLERGKIHGLGVLEGRSPRVVRTRHRDRAARWRR
jgi:hypothetical protein